MPSQYLPECTTLGCMALFLLAARGGTAPTEKPAQPPQEVKMELTSSAFSEGAEIPQRYTCDSEDVSPPLSWTAPPQGTTRLILICDDPDAPAGTWVHWVLQGLPPDARPFPEGGARRGH